VPSSFDFISRKICFEKNDSLKVELLDLVLVNSHIIKPFLAVSDAPAENVIVSLSKTLKLYPI